MQLQDVIIVGSSGHARVVIDIMEKSGTFRIVGLIDSFRNVGDETFDYKVLGKVSDTESLLNQHSGCKLFVAVGDNYARHKIVEEIRAVAPHAEFVSAVHPSAQIGRNVQIGQGVAIMAGVVINSNSEVGDFVIINTKASLDHDCKMKLYSSLAPGATVGGSVMIGEFSAISLGASVIHGRTIGQHVVVGAGSTVIGDIGDNKLAYGVPSRVVRDRKPGEKYL